MRRAIEVNSHFQSPSVWREFSAPWDMAENGYKLIKGMGEKYGM